MRYAYGRTGEAMARRCVATGVPLDPWSYPLFERAVDASLGVIVHNQVTRDRVLASRPLARIATVPHHLSLEGLPEVSSEEARRALGIEPGTFAVATFGFLTASKRPAVLLRAFARLRREVPSARLLIVGEVSPHFDFDRVFTPELREGVTITGRLEIDRFLLYMRACDVAVNLRHPTAGETSGTVIRLLGLGKPLIVNETGSFAEIPDDCCAKVPSGRYGGGPAGGLSPRARRGRAAPPPDGGERPRATWSSTTASPPRRGSTRTFCARLSRAARGPSEPCRRSPPIRKTTC